MGKKSVIFKLIYKCHVITNKNLNLLISQHNTRTPQKAYMLETNAYIHT